MGVFTQVVSNIKGFAHKFTCKCAYAVLCERGLSGVAVVQGLLWKYNNILVYFGV